MIASRTRLDDLEDLGTLALEAVAQALRDGDVTHKPGSWLTENPGNQIDHIQAHLKAILAGSLFDENGHSHIKHIICRAIIFDGLQAHVVAR